MVSSFQADVAFYRLPKLIVRAGLKVRLEPLLDAAVNFLPVPNCLIAWGFYLSNFNFSDRSLSVEELSFSPSPMTWIATNLSYSNAPENFTNFNYKRSQETLIAGDAVSYSADPNHLKSLLASQSPQFSAEQRRTSESLEPGGKAVQFSMKSNSGLISLYLRPVTVSKAALSNFEKHFNPKRLPTYFRFISIAKQSNERNPQSEFFRHRVPGMFSSEMRKEYGTVTDH